LRENVEMRWVVSREHGDIDFGLREKPEESLPEHGESIGRYRRWLVGQKADDWEKVRADEAVREQTKGRGEDDAENQGAQNRVDEPGPDGKREPRQGHATGAEVDGGNAEIDAVRERGKGE
jgi:hypothetical protein